MVKIELLKGSEVVSKASLLVGILDRKENEINDEYLDIINWTKDYKKVSLKIRFFPPANGLIFRVRYLYAESKKERNEADRNMDDAQIILKQTISLIIPPKLHFSISTKDGNTKGVNENEIAIVTCQAEGGYPEQVPIITFNNQVLEETQDVERSKLMTTSKFIAKLSDHNKLIYCSAGRTGKTLIINVFHHPTEVIFNPSFSNQVPNGSEIYCKAKDGYPIPKINWKFISGPINASKYYKIKPSNKLSILKHAPLGTKWVFNCSASNSIPKSYDKGSTKTLSFVVKPIAFVHTVIIILIFLLVIVVAIIIVIFVKARRDRCHILKFFKKKQNKGPEEPDNQVAITTKSIYQYGQCAESEEAVEMAAKKKKRRKKSKTVVQEDNEDVIL